MARPRESASAQYVRDVLHPQEAPPPVTVRYFYTSPLAIDDPLSPLPPPLTGPSATYRSPPRPFSTYDNAALDKAWLEVRKKLLKNAEQNGGEKSRSRGGTMSSGSGSLPRGLAGRHISVTESKRRSLVGPLGSPRAPESPRQRPQRVPSTEDIPGVKKIIRSEAWAGDESLSSSLRVLDPADSSLPTDSPSITGNPFIRAPSRTNVRDTPRPRSTSRPVPLTTDSYDWDHPTGTAAEQSRQRDSVCSKASGPSANVPVGVSRLHNVVLPDLE
jgi:hypothetical protein